MSESQVIVTEHDYTGAWNEIIIRVTRQVLGSAADRVPAGQLHYGARYARIRALATESLWAVKRNHEAVVQVRGNLTVTFSEFRNGTAYYTIAEVTQ